MGQAGRDPKSREHTYGTSFGKRRPMKKPSKSDTLAQNLCIFRTTEIC